MSLVLTQENSPVDIREIKAAIKVPEVHPGDTSFQIGSPILDVVTKLGIGDIPDIQDGVLVRQQETVRIEVEHIIAFDGLSLRKLDLSTLRNAFTLKGTGKLSVKNRRTGLPEIASDFTDFGLELLGVPVLKTVAKIGRKALDLTPVTGNMSHSSPFGATLQIGQRELGKFSSVTHKWNKYLRQGDEEKFGGDMDEFTGKPVLRSTSDMSLASTDGNQLAARLNVPIFGLSRDHARDVVIHVRSLVHEVQFNQRRRELASESKSINLGPIRYRTLVT